MLRRILRTKVRRLLGRDSPKLSDILLKPTWADHPLSKRCGADQAWYVLFVPTLHEGHEVGAEIGEALKSQGAELTIVVAYFAGDPTEQDILREAAHNSAITVVRVDATAGDYPEMERSFSSKLETLIKERGRSPQDVITVTIPDLRSRRHESEA